MVICMAWTKLQKLFALILYSWQTYFYTKICCAEICFDYLRTTWQKLRNTLTMYTARKAKKNPEIGKAIRAGETVWVNMQLASPSSNASKVFPPFRTKSPHIVLKIKGSSQTLTMLKVIRPYNSWVMKYNIFIMMTQLSLSIIHVTLS